MDIVEKGVKEQQKYIHGGGKLIVGEEKKVEETKRRRGVRKVRMS